MTALAWGTLATPVGELSLACTPEGVARVAFGSHPALPGPAGGPAAAMLAQARGQLAAYFRGELRAFGVPVDWSGLAGGRRHLLGLLRDSVPFGETVTYGALAARAGLAAGGRGVPARVAGQIMGSNPVPVIVPCHRVVAGDSLGGYSGGAGVEVKRWLLIFEGAIPATLDWDPAGL